MFVAYQEVKETTSTSLHIARIIISDSILLNFLLISFFYNEYDSFPVFFQLKNINQTTIVTLIF